MVRCEMYGTPSAFYHQVYCSVHDKRSGQIQFDNNRNQSNWLKKKRNSPVILFIRSDLVIDKK